VIQKSATHKTPTKSIQTFKTGVRLHRNVIPVPGKWESLIAADSMLALPRDVRHPPLSKM
jgi:hypothetical protein